MDRNIKILHDSFPRSGNHFLEECLKMAFTKADIVWGFHKIHLLNSNEYDGVITSVRNPIDCISSYMSLINTFDEKNTKKIILWYKRFISETIKIKKNIFVCSFENLTKDPSKIINNFSKYNNIPFFETINKEKAINNIKEDSSFIHKSDKIKKECAKNIILKYKKDLKECQELYKNAIF